MNRTYQSPEASRTADLWRRFIGCFGGDAVHRKYGDGIPPEWTGVVAQLTDAQLEKGVKRMVYNGVGHLPSLPEFVKLCRSVSREYDEGPQKEAPPITYTASDDYTLARRFANLVLADWLTWRTRGKREIFLTEQVARAMYAKAREVADTIGALYEDGDPEADTQRFCDALCDQAIALCDADEAKAYRKYLAGKTLKVEA